MPRISLSTYILTAIDILCWYFKNTSLELNHLGRTKSSRFYCMSCVHSTLNHIRESYETPQQTSAELYHLSTSHRAAHPIDGHHFQISGTASDMANQKTGRWLVIFRWKSIRNFHYRRPSRIGFWVRNWVKKLIFFIWRKYFFTMKKLNISYYYSTVMNTCCFV